MAALAALAMTWPGMLSAQAQAPSSFARISASGSFLAARHAGGQKDAAAAAAYYRAALRGDPRNNELLGRTFLAVLANGEVEDAVKLAERVLQIDKSDRIARLVLGVRAIKLKQYPAARRELAQSIRGPITDLAATLLSAWTMANQVEAKQATDSIDKLSGADWYAIFKDLHSALILDVAGQKKEAAKRFERSYKLDPTALRVVQSYGSFLSRQGNAAEATQGLREFRAGAAAPSADRRGDPRGQGRQEAAHHGRHAAGRRRRGALRARRGARTPRRRGSRSRLPAACPLSVAIASAGAALARRSLRGDEEARARQQDLRASAAELAAAA